MKIRKAFTKQKNFKNFSDAPRIQDLPYENYIEQGKDFSITCEAVGSPGYPPAIKWTKVRFFKIIIIKFQFFKIITIFFFFSFYFFHLVT